MDCSSPGFLSLHHLPEFAQTHVQGVGDATQPSRPLSSPSPAFSLSQHQGLSSKSALCIRWPKCWSFSFNISPSNEYSGLISFRIDWFDLLAVQRTLKSLLHTTRRGTNTPVHHLEKRAGYTHSSTRGLRPPEQLERPAGFPSSLESTLACIEIQPVHPKRNQS